MSIFSKKNNQFGETEDLDSGYNNRYYNQRERSESRPERRSYDEGGREDTTDFYGGRQPERPARSSVYEEEENARYYRDRGYEEEPVRRRVDKEPVAPARPENQGTLYYTPESYADMRGEIVSGVAECHVVVVNVRNLLGTPDMIRLLDYLMGAVQALGATLRRLGGNNLLLVPADVEIDEDELLIPEEDELVEYGEEDEEEDYSDYDEE